MRYDAATGAETAKIDLPSASSGVIVDFGSVWVTGTENGELYRVDPKTDQIAATIGVNSQPRFLTSGEGSIWVLSQGEGTVQRIDGKSGELLATIAADAKGEGGDIAVGGGSVWITTMLVPVIKIDPQTNSSVGAFKRPRGVSETPFVMVMGRCGSRATRCRGSSRRSNCISSSHGLGFRLDTRLALRSHWDESGCPRFARTDQGRASRDLPIPHHRKPLQEIIQLQLRGLSPVEDRLDEVRARSVSRRSG